MQDICCTFLFVTEQNACRRSVGCILAELLQRKPLFPGKDYIDQLKLIIKTLGSPSDSDLSFINSQKAQQYIKALPKAQVGWLPTLGLFAYILLLQEWGASCVRACVLRGKPIVFK